MKSLDNGDRGPPPSSDRLTTPAGDFKVYLLSLMQDLVVGTYLAGGGEQYGSDLSENSLYNQRVRSGESFDQTSTQGVVLH